MPVYFPAPLSPPSFQATEANGNTVEANKHNRTILQKGCDLIKKICSIAWDIFSTIIFPIGLARFAIKHMAPVILLPAARKFSLEVKKQYLQELEDKYSKQQAKLQNQLDKVSPQNLKQKTQLENQLSLLEQEYKTKQTALENAISAINGLHASREEFLNDLDNHAEQITITTADGVNLDTLKIKNDRSNKWIVWFCPNAACYETELSSLKALSDTTGANIYTGNYRGVMRSEGTVQSTRDLVFDGEAMVQKLLSEGVPPEDILIHGWSLGGAVGAKVASNYPKTNLCSDRSFASLTAFLKAFIPVVGGLLGKIISLCGWRFNGVENFQKIEGKKLIIYCDTDGVVRTQASLYKGLTAQGIEPNNVEMIFDTDTFIEQWKRENPQVKPEDADHLAYKAFIEASGAFNHGYPLAESTVFAYYVDFVKNALNLE